MGSTYWRDKAMGVSDPMLESETVMDGAAGRLLRSYGGN